MAGKTRTTAGRKRGVLAYWGYVVAVGALLGWLNPLISPAVIALLAVVAVFYFFFQVPRPCRADNRRDDERCRNNAYGLLKGCHLQEHKWQNLKMLVNYRRWRALLATVWSHWTTAVPTLANTATVISGAIAAVVIFV